MLLIVNIMFKSEILEVVFLKIRNLIKMLNNILFYKFYCNNLESKRNEFWYWKRGSKKLVCELCRDNDC